MDLTWEQLVTSISDLRFLASTALGRLVKGYHQTLRGHLQHNNLNAPLFASHFFGLYASLIRNKSLGREGSLRMLWPHHSRSILFQNTSYFKMFGHLEAVFHGAFHLIKQQRVPLKSTGRNINSPVKKKEVKRGRF